MKELIQALEQMEIPWNDEMIRSFEGYMKGILEWNQKINLTAVTDPQEFISKHFIDSILCSNLKAYRQSRSVIDVGTGAGFPGIPLAILSPEKEFLLADSLAKRLKVIDTLTGALSIENVTTVHGRAEDLAHQSQYRGGFDLCVSRAVANMAVLVEYCLPFVRVGGYLLSYKGPDAEKETRNAEKAIKILGGKTVEVHPVCLKGYDHYIVVIEKVKDTPAKFPRKAGTPVKEPIL